MQGIVNGGDDEKTSAAQAMLALQKIASKHDKKVEYKHLCDTVSMISFPQWTVMKIDWKCGISTSIAIEYKKAGDMPYPTITKEDVEHTTKYKGTITMNTYVVNGVPLILGCPDRQIEGIRSAQDAVVNTIIQEPLSYEPSVPRVFGVKSTKNGRRKT